MNKNYLERDRIIFGEYDPEKYKYGGIRRFECEYDKAKELYDKGFIDPKDGQNDSPTAKEFIDDMEDVSFPVTFMCYAVGPERSDYRVTIEGITMELPDWEYDWIQYFVERYRYANEFSFEHVLDTYYLHAWWD